MANRYVLCVDDEAIIIESLKRELRSELPHLRIESAYSGEAALGLLSEISEDGGEPAVLVTDDRMPGMHGHVLLREARKAYPRMYGILLTGYSDIDAIGDAVNEAGLFSYFRKPWVRRDLVLAVRRAAELYDIEAEREYLRHRVMDLNAALIANAENRALEGDPDSIRHVRQVACYAALLGRSLGLTEADQRRLSTFAPLHDIGKMGIPLGVLGKQSSLSAEEFEAAKSHVEIGARLLNAIEVDPIASDLILHHHERWDGTGYPSEMAGDSIPLSARITSVADALDAMLTDRPNRAALPFEAAAEEIISDSGKRFDPAVVEAFRAEEDSFREISDATAVDCCARIRNLG
jgi:putative two-component system response regulator